MINMIHQVDITNFVTWFVSQVISLFGQIFTILDSITFAGTSVLKVIITIIILSSLVGVVLTISQGFTVISNKHEHIVNKRENAIREHNRQIARWERYKRERNKQK